MGGSVRAWDSRIGTGPGWLLLRSSFKEGFYVGDDCGHAAGRETGEEGLAVALSRDSEVEQD